MLRSITPLLLVTLACTPADRPGPDQAAAPVNEARSPASSRPAPRPAPAVPGTFQCRGEHQHVAKFLSASLELADDQSFELQYSDVDPDGGRSIYMQGAWHLDGGEIRATPTAGRYLTWTGDAHRHQHGEPSRYRETERRGVYTHERRWPIAITGGQTRIELTELATTVGSGTPGDAGVDYPRCPATEYNR